MFIIANFHRNTTWVRLLSIIAVAFLCGLYHTAFGTHTAHATTTTAARTALPAGKGFATRTCGDKCFILYRTTPTLASPGSLADDSEGWNTILKMLPPSSTLRITAGTYTMSRPLTIPTGVTIDGGNATATTLTINPAAMKNFAYSFLITPLAPAGKTPATHVTVKNLTIDGARSRTPRPQPNMGGGIKLGTHWTVSHITFTNLNYFKAWVKDTTNTTITHNTFTNNPGHTSSGNDNIGGGNTTNLAITYNTFTPTSTGNSIDVLLSRNTTITHNTITGTPTAPHNIFLEGINEATIAHNTLTWSNINAQSNTKYTSAVYTWNPSQVTIRNNTITNSVSHGILLKYDTLRNPTTTPPPTSGGNTITNNTISHTNVCGIVIIAEAPNLITAPDTITNNTLNSTFTRATRTWNTGYGTTPAAAILIGAGTPTATGNTAPTLTPGSTLMKVGTTNTRGVTASI